MSTPDPAPAAAADAPPPKKKKKLVLFITAPIALGGVFAGGIFAAKAGLIPGVAAAEAEKPHGPELQYAETEDGAKRLKTSYALVEGAFTTNLANSPRLVQVEIGVATNYDPTMLEAVKTHELPLRSAVLGVLAQQPESAFASAAARSGVQRQLRVAINRVLTDKEGFGGITDVYFSSLVVQ